MQKEGKEQNEGLGRLKGITEITQSDDILSEMPVPQKPLADMLRKMNKSFLLSGNDVEIITDFQTMSDGLEVHKRRRAGSGPEVSAQSSLRRYAYADSHRRP